MNLLIIKNAASYETNETSLNKNKIIIMFCMFLDEVFYLDFFLKLLIQIKLKIIKTNKDKTNFKHQIFTKLKKSIYNYNHYTSIFFSYIRISI